MNGAVRIKTRNCLLMKYPCKKKKRTAQDFVLKGLLRKKRGAVNEPGSKGQAKEEEGRKMDRKTAKEELKRHLKEYLENEHGLNVSRPFSCLSPEHQDKNPSMSFDKERQRVHCFSCGVSYDLIDLVRQDYNLSSYGEAFSKGCELFGIDIDGRSDSPRPPASQVRGSAITPRPERTEPPDKEEDYTNFFLEANRNLGRTSYHRGISLETLNRFMVGYVEAWKHPKAPAAPTTPRLIIPTSRYSYIARDTRAESDIPEGQKKYTKSKAGKIHFLNFAALRKSGKPVFITEGEIDALSIIDVGGEAVALGSVSGCRKLLELLEHERPQQPLIIALDNDERGNEAARGLAEGLGKLGILFKRWVPPAGHKDANEALTADRAALSESVHEAEERAVSVGQEKEEARRAEYLKTSAGEGLNTFIKEIEESARAVFFPTGFTALDEILDGGLYAGLYIIGAISSLGKTTLALQIMDYIAASGYDVLIFSLEMAKKELIAKSVSRHTWLMTQQKERDLSENCAKTVRGILTGSRYANYSTMGRNVIEAAIMEYQRYASHVYIHEGIGDIGVNEIKEAVKRHIEITGNRPIVLIDYAQILAPFEFRATDKQNTDKAVLELKRLSRDYSIPVIGISSFNRENYTAPVSMAAFKESGAVEYSSDVLIGLQYEGMDYEDDETDKARPKRIRKIIKEQAELAKQGQPQKIQVKVLKNRNGAKGETVLNYYPMFNCFCNIEKDETEEWKAIG